MTKRAVGFILVAAVLLVVAIVIILQTKSGDPRIKSEATSRPATGPPASTTVSKVPKHYETAPDPESLGPTLAPARFFGKTRQAYEVAGQIPLTLSQLPCYCHCDETVGHESLYSCFEDEHASSCAVCVDEALLAYKLENSGKTPAQIREQIIAQYSRASH